MEEKKIIGRVRPHLEWSGKFFDYASKKTQKFSSREIMGYPIYESDVHNNFCVFFEIESRFMLDGFVSMESIDSVLLETYGTRSDDEMQ